MADDVKKHLSIISNVINLPYKWINRLTSLDFSIAMVFVGYVYFQEYQEHLPLFRNQESNTSGDEIFNLLDEFLSSNKYHGKLRRYMH